MPERIKFNKSSLQKLPIPTVGKRATYYDTETEKLVLRITGTGTKTFYVIKRASNKVVWYKLGTFPDMSVETARREAVKAKDSFRPDSTPADIRRAKKEELTFAELFKEYGEEFGSTKKSWAAMTSLYSNHLNKQLGASKITDITGKEISAVLSRMDKAGLAGATLNNARALVSIIFNAMGHRKLNPVADIKTRPKVKRDRFLQADEMPRFFKSLADEPNETLRDYILLALLTGARRSNLLGMRWRDVNLKEATWRIEVTKNNTPQNVTLSPEAMEVLQCRKEAAEDGTVYVFPGAGASGHIEEPKKGVIRVMERAGIPYGRNVENGVTLHDLRRTLGSWQARTGASMAIIGKSLNHQSQQTTAIYARLDLDPVRASVNTATSAMMEAAGLKQTAEVTPIKSGKSAA